MERREGNDIKTTKGKHSLEETKDNPRKTVPS